MTYQTFEFPGNPTTEDFERLRKHLGLSQEQMAHMLGYRNRAGYTALLQRDNVPHGAVIRLMHAYGDGYRPDDWPIKKLSPQKSGK